MFVMLRWILDPLLRLSSSLQRTCSRLPCPRSQDGEGGGRYSGIAFVAFPDCETATAVRDGGSHFTFGVEKLSTRTVSESSGV
jgi:hypothetical protein